MKLFLKRFYNGYIPVTTGYWMGSMIILLITGLTGKLPSVALIIPWMISGFTILHLELKYKE